MMKIDTRAATKIFAQECLELIMDWFKIRTFVDEEIDMKETIQMEICRQTTSTTITQATVKPMKLTMQLILVRIIKMKIRRSYFGMM